MSNDRYTPPNAFVEDVPDLTAPPRPRQVTWAVRLLWATAVCSIPSFYLSAVRAHSTSKMLHELFFEALVTAVACFAYVGVHRGWNWARIAVLIFTLIEIVALPLGPLPGTTAFERYYDGVELACDVVCMILLFTSPGSSWFKRNTR